MINEALIESEKKERRHYDERSFYYCRDLERTQPTPDGGDLSVVASLTESSREAFDMSLATLSTFIVTSAEGLRMSAIHSRC